MEDLKQQYLDEMKHLINSEHRDEIKIDELKGNFNSMSIEISKKEKLQQLEQVANLNTYPSKCFNSFCYDDDEDYTVVITPDLLITDSLIMENKHLDTIPETKSDEFIKSSVENLVPIPKRLLHDDPIPLPDTLDFSNVVRVFLSFFTYPVTSSILLSSGSEDTIFDPGICHFSSLEPGLSHRSGTFIKFNESPMEILSSTCSPMDQ
nr:hypothetical protein [Tanacetum cinerariifolium]